VFFNPSGQDQKGDKPEGVLHHESFCYKVCVDFVRLGFAYVVFTQGRRFNRVDNTHFLVTGNKVSNKVVTVVCC